MRDYEELAKALRDSADWADHFAVLMGRDSDVSSEIKREAADAIEELVNLVDKFKWISVEERLPEKYDQVLVYGRNGVQIDYYTGEKSVCGNPLFMVSEAKVTHWLYVPEPPKEDGNG